VSLIAMLRLSLRELLIFIALAALAIASLKYASLTWLSIVAAVAMTAFFIALVVAAVDRGPQQSFAIGFVLVAAAYGFLVVSPSEEERNRSPEMSTYSGRLPTSQLLRFLYRGINSSGYYDNITGKFMPGYDPHHDPNVRIGRNLVPLPGGGVGQAISYRQVPSTEEFMRIGHCWWALLLGYAGGRFACVVYHRRMRDEQKLPADTQ
jgi:hypothetical protein